MLRESPALFVTPHLDGHRETVMAFLEMKEEDRAAYMQLYNMYSDDRAQWTATMRAELEAVIADAGVTPFINVSWEEAVKVWQIWMSNAYEFGVFLKTSRFNHSCRPNAEYFWDEDSEPEVQEVRAVRKIQEGEEITVCYSSFWPQTLAERQVTMAEEYNFRCGCDGCDLTEQEVEKETWDCRLFQAFEKRKEELKATADSEGDWRKVVFCLKQMVRLAEDIKTISLKNILRLIVEEGFEASCKMYSFSTQDNPEKDKLMADVNYFATQGHQLSTLLHGDHHSRTQQWEARKRTPQSNAFS